MIEGAVYNDEGLVGLTYYQPIPKLLDYQGKKIYFDCQYGISMAFVDEADVPALLNVLGGCCGGQKKIIYLANEAQYKHWQDGNGGR